jgi:hypothetical protein
MELILQSTEDALLRLLNFAAIDPPEDDDYEDEVDDDEDLDLDLDDDTVADTGLFPATDETEVLEDADFDDEDDEDDPLDELRGSELY